MAKTISSPIQISGKLGNVVYVNSKAYGYHARMPRGTHKKAVVNKTLAQNAKKATDVTGLAKTLHTVFTDICRSCKQRDLWQVMLSRMFKAPSAGISDLLNSLTGLEMNAWYPLERILPMPKLSLSLHKAECTVVLHPLSVAQFASALSADCYYYELTIVWLGKKGKLCETSTLESEWISISEEASQFEWNYTKPVKAKHYLLLLKIQGGREEQAIDSLSAIGVQVAGVGDC